MNTELFPIIYIALGLLNFLVIIFLVIKTLSIGKKITLQTFVITKIQNSLKSKSATNTVTQNAEIIYQDLLQQLMPIVNAAGIKPRKTDEHALWQWAGGLMDEYTKNPYVLEQVRQAIKLDSSIARAVETYTDHASKFLSYLVETDSDGLLATAFSDGLLGQTMTLLAQARGLAINNN